MIDDHDDIGGDDDDHHLNDDHHGEGDDHGDEAHHGEDDHHFCHHSPLHKIHLDRNKTPSQLSMVMTLMMSSMVMLHMYVDSNADVDNGGDGNDDIEGAPQQKQDSKPNHEIEGRTF